MRLVSLLLVLVTVSACNTFEGMGEDISNAGDAISGSASKTEKEMSK